MTTKEDMKAFENFMGGLNCPIHQIPVRGDDCRECKKEMMLDFIVNTMEDGLVGADEVAQCVREKVFTLGDLQRAIDRRAVAA